ncbi:MAG: hypothetical protein AAF892_11450 [Cyanobacteria bacterium P01_D01_bin.71]
MAAVRGRSPPSPPVTDIPGQGQRGLLSLKPTPPPPLKIASPLRV